MAPGHRVHAGFSPTHLGADRAPGRGGVRADVTGGGTGGGGGEGVGRGATEGVLEAGGCAPSGCGMDALWHREWEGRLRCWWHGLPYAARSSLAVCAGALGLHLASRFDALYSGGGAAAGRSRETSAAAERGCGWVGERAAQLELPTFPELGHFEFG